MTKRSHNKKRNVGIIYDQLINYISKALIENRLDKAAEGKRIIIEHFNKDSQIYKELKLFNAIVVTDVKDGSLATQILENAKGAARSHDTEMLRHEKNMLIKDINYNLGKGFYSTSVDNYKRYASVQVLFNEWRKFNKADIQKVTQYESKVHSILLEEKSVVKFEKNPDEVNNVIVKLYTEKFNEKFSNKMNNLQNDILREYAFEGSISPDRLVQLKSNAVEAIENFISQNDNRIIESKYKAVIGKIESLPVKDINDETISKYLSVCGLFTEVKENSNE